MMATVKHPIDSIEKTIACSAFAEADEACPFDLAGEEHSRVEAKAPRKSILVTMEEDMTCCTFAEAGENCPVFR